MSPGSTQGGSGDQLAALHEAVETALEAGQELDPQALAGRLGVPLRQVEAALAALRAVSPAARAARPAAIGDYRLLREIGRGGMGVVYEAWHPRLARKVALKSLPPEETDPARLQRFDLEARAAARLSHPNLVAVHDVGVDAGRPFLVMDLVEGPSLGRLLAAGPLEPRRAAEMARDLARGLAHAHTQLVLHRDIKPDNVLLGADGAPMLSDFGLAKDLTSSRTALTRTGQMLGTLAYAPPEQLEGRADEVDRRSDVYGLGATLYHMLTGVPPNGSLEGVSPGEFLARLADDPPPPSSRRRGLDRDLETIVLRCLEREPGRRYPGAEALAADLERFLAHEPILAGRPGLARRLGKWRQRHPAAVAALAAVALLGSLGGGAAAVWVAHERGRERAARAAAAEREAVAAWAALRSASLPEQALELALAAAESARRWRELAPGPPAAEAEVRAALELRSAALALEHWALAAQACRQARAAGLERAAADEALAGVEAARTRLVRERVQAARAVLDGLAAQPGEEASQEAVFALARYPEPEVARELVARLHSATAALAAVEDELLEAATPEGEREGLRAALASFRAAQPPRDYDAPIQAAIARVLHDARELASRSPGLSPGYLMLLAARQRDRLPRGMAAGARAAGEALGRLGLEEQVVTLALGAHLRVEADPRRAIPIGLALRRLGTPIALAFVSEACRRYGPSTPFSRRLAGPGAGDGLDALRERARERRHGGDARGALELLGEALEAQPETAILWVERALVRDDLGDHPGAISDLEQALTCDPGLSVAHQLLSSHRLQLGEPRRALEHAQQAVTLEPTDPLAWKALAIARLAAEDGAAAVEACDEALRLAPDRADLWLARARILNRTGDQVRARDDLDAALRLDPDYVDALQLRAKLDGRAGRLAQAEADLSRALELAPRRSSLWAARGALRARSEDLSGAIQDCRRALELDPGQVEARQVLDRLQAQ